MIARSLPREIADAIERARATGATYELMLALAFAARSGLSPEGEAERQHEESAELRARLGVVSLPLAEAPGLVSAR